MTDTHDDQDVPECLACGTCCSSTLRRYVPVTGDDHARLGDAGTPLVTWEENRAYMRLEDGHCAALRLDEAAGKFACTAMSRARRFAATSPGPRARAPGNARPRESARSSRCERGAPTDRASLRPRHIRAAAKADLVEGELRVVGDRHRPASVANGAPVAPLEAARERVAALVDDPLVNDCPSCRTHRTGSASFPVARARAPVDERDAHPLGRMLDPARKRTGHRQVNVARRSVAIPPVRVREPLLPLARERPFAPLAEPPSACGAPRRRLVPRLPSPPATPRRRLGTVAIDAEAYVCESTNAARFAEVEAARSDRLRVISPLGTRLVDLRALLSIDDGLPFGQVRCRTCGASRRAELAWWERPAAGARGDGFAGSERERCCSLVTRGFLRPRRRHDGESANGREHEERTRGHASSSHARFAPRTEA